MSKISRRLASLILGVSIAACLFAQELPKADGPRVLATSVGYGSLKSARQAGFTPETRAELDRLEKSYAAANAARNYDEAMKIVHHAMAVAGGTPYTPLRALSASLIAKADHALIEPAQPVVIKFGEMYTLDQQPEGKFAGSVVVMKFGSRDPEGAPLKTFEVSAADLASKPVSVSVVAPDIPDGNYTLAVMLKPVAADAENVPLRTGVSVHLERGLTAKMTALRARITKTQPVDPSVEYRVALYDLVNSGEVAPGRIDFNAEFADANSILDAVAKKTDPWMSRKGDLHKAYLSGVDKTLQPYRVYIPSGYDGVKHFPLVVALHGMGGDENSMFDQYQKEGKSVVKDLAEQHGYIVVCPKGRGSASMYMGSAEKDVLDVLEDVKRAYLIDSTRVFLTGHSMGGYGTWSVSMAHPTLFAALAPIAGGGNVMGMEKIAQIPQIVFHGDADGTVPVDRSREMVAAAKKLNVEMKYVETPGGSHTGVAVPAFPLIFDFFDAHAARKNTDMPVTGLQRQ